MTGWLDAVLVSGQARYPDITRAFAAVGGVCITSLQVFRWDGTN